MVSSRQRLCVPDDLAVGASVALSAAHAHYVRHVLRLKAGDAILLFNGRDGEWRAELAESTKEGQEKRALALLVRKQLRQQHCGPDIDYLFAPLKRARLDFMVQKATEMGVARLRPVLTRRTTATRVNIERLRANAIEAAEQCGILRLPELYAPERLESVISRWPQTRVLIFCDEQSATGDPLAILAGLSPGPLGLLIGPEGGFDDREREMLSLKPFVVKISLGPRILRAETAAIAALALVNAALGDWR